jgi:hypothetical protein
VQTFSSTQLANLRLDKLFDKSSPDFGIAVLGMHQRAHHDVALTITSRWVHIVDFVAYWL